MELLGNTGFIVLLLLAGTWVVGVRTKLDAGTTVIIGALYFLTATLVLAFSDISKLNSLWLVPSGFAFLLLVSLLSAYLPVLAFPFRILASLFASIVRIGIPAHKIQAARLEGHRKTVERYFQGNDKNG